MNASLATEAPPNNQRKHWHCHLPMDASFVLYKLQLIEQADRARTLGDAGRTTHSWVVANLRLVHL